MVDDAGNRLRAASPCTISLAFGSRVLEIEAELEIDEPPAGDPWESYYAARFAWPDEAVESRSRPGLARQASEARRIEAPHYCRDLALRALDGQILTGGTALPSARWHPHGGYLACL